MSTAPSPERGTVDTDRGRRGPTRGARPEAALPIALSIAGSDPSGDHHLAAGREDEGTHFAAGADVEVSLGKQLYQRSAEAREACHAHRSITETWGTPRYAMRFPTRARAFALQRGRAKRRSSIRLRG